MSGMRRFGRLPVGDRYYRGEEAMTTESFRAGVARELRRLHRISEGALAQVSDADFFREPAPESNSVAVLVKHLSGNMLHRWRDFPRTDGEGGRDRDLEFRISPDDSRGSLEREWAEGWETLLGVVEGLSDDSMSRTVTIRGESHTVQQALQRQLVHYAYHVGQIVYVARLHAGAKWKSLSIPKGESAAFNQRRGRYLLG